MPFAPDNFDPERAEVIATCGGVMLKHQNGWYVVSERGGGCNCLALAWSLFMYRAGMTNRIEWG